MKDKTKYSYPLDLQRFVEDYIRSKGLEFDSEVIIDDNKKIARNIVLSVVPDWAYGYIYFNQINVETYTAKRAYGILEVVKTGADKDHIFIREDLPLGSKVRVHAHALGHADFSKNNLFYKTGLNFIKPLLNSSQHVKEMFTKYAEENGINALNDLSEICHILFNLSSRIDLDFSYPVYKSKRIEYSKDFPETPEGDILKGFIHIPSIPEYVKELIALYRDYMIYVKFLRYTKYTNEGWASYVESFLPELWQIILKSEQFKGYSIEDAELRTSPDNGLTILSILTKKHIIRDEGKYFVPLNLILNVLFRALSNPYLTGYFYYKENVEEGKDLLNLRSKTTDTDILMFLKDETVFYKFLSYIFPFKLIPATKFLKTYQFLYEIFEKFIDSMKSTKVSSYSMKGEIPKDGISMKRVIIQMKEPYQSLGDLEFNRTNSIMKIKGATIDLEKYMNVKTVPFFENGIDLAVDIPELTPYVFMDNTYKFIRDNLESLIRKTLKIDVTIIDP